MTLHDRLGTFQRGTVGCGVCHWIDSLNEADRATFDEWVTNGGNISKLWRECRADPDNPVPVQLPQFGKCIRDHHLGGARVVS